jgi:hypothetical protein
MKAIIAFRCPTVGPTTRVTLAHSCKRWRVLAAVQPIGRSHRCRHITADVADDAARERPPPKRSDLYT